MVVSGLEVIIVLILLICSIAYTFGEDEFWRNKELENKQLMDRITDLHKQIKKFEEKLNEVKCSDDDCTRLLEECDKEKGCIVIYWKLLVIFLAVAIILPMMYIVVICIGWYIYSRNDRKAAGRMMRQPEQDNSLNTN